MHGQTPPVTGLADLARLVGSLLGEMVRHRGRASMRHAIRGWSERTSARLGSRNFILKVGSKRILLVGGTELSRCILHARPGMGLTVGETKRKAMAVLAPDALTVSVDEDWVRRRAFNEFVLEPGRTHSLAPVLAPRIREAFRSQITDIESIRGAMRRAMLAIDFGPDVAPEQVATDLEYLSDLVQKPLRRLVLGPFSGRRRRRLKSTLGALWASAPGGPPSLLQRARAARPEPIGEEGLDQIPHWMFTFTGSATDLLARALWLTLSDENTRRRVVEEIRSANDDPIALDQLPLLTACLLESAQLYPPVTRTFHQTTTATRQGDTELSAGIEILHWFPLLQPAELPAPHFRPDRWTTDHSADDEVYDPFLGGARHCPGRSLILLVCKVAMAELLVTRPLALASPPLNITALPIELPEGELRFRSIASA